MAEITGWGRSGWGTDGWGTPDDINVTGNQVSGFVGSVTVTARRPALVNVTGASGIISNIIGNGFCGCRHYDNNYRPTNSK